MRKDSRKGQFSVHCIMCGKTFFSDTAPECGGLISGKPMCETRDIQKAIAKNCKPIARSE